jgi:hypothetical protein
VVPPAEHVPTTSTTVVDGPSPTPTTTNQDRGEAVVAGEVVLTQNLHLAPSTQQAEQASFTRERDHKTCQSIFPEN